VDILGIFSFYAGNMQTVDIDKDGIDEVAICIDDNFLILKFNSSPNHQAYEIYYLKQNELNTENEYQTYYGAIMYDLLNNGNYDILISMTDATVKPSAGRFVTKIYKPDSLTSINNEDRNIIPSSDILYQNYPNPFNPSTTIIFQMTHYSEVSIKIYDILGKEVRQLLEDNLPSGEHTIQWDGKDDKGNPLSGGIYFIHMVADSYQKTIKTVLLK
jgi:hypothetical protein